MVLVPLSAFSVACNVLQMIETGVKVLSKAADYRNSERGVLAEQRDLRDVLYSLNTLSTHLSSSLPEVGAMRQHTSEEARLLEANRQCQRLSQEFIEFLDCSKLKDRYAVLDSLRVSVKPLWHKDKMEAMQKALSQARDNLNVAFLVYIKFILSYQDYGIVLTYTLVQSKPPKQRNSRSSRILHMQKTVYCRL